MAVLIASRLRKEFSGDPLFDGVSFKVERRDRLALAGPHGAGKTTLLRMLTRETRLDGGGPALQKGKRGAPPDQRPPPPPAVAPPARPAPAARTRVDPAGIRPRRCQGPRRGRRGFTATRVRDGWRRPRRRHPLRLLGCPGEARARGRLRLARPRHIRRARARI